MRAVVIGVVGFLALVGMTTGVGASVAPSARVAPHVGLRDGREVTVHWRGMLSPKKGDTTQFLQIAECNRAFTPETATAQAYFQDCDEYDAQMSTHRGFWEGAVHIGAVGLANLPCAGDSCELAVIAGHSEAGENFVIERVAVAPITFRD